MAATDEKRRRGGQPGNQNARTHGFYARAKLSAERLRLLTEAREHGSVADDIALMRTEIARLIADSGGDYDRGELAALARALISAESLHYKLTGGADRDRLLAALDSVLADVTGAIEEAHA